MKAQAFDCPHCGQRQVSIHDGDVLCDNCKQTYMPDRSARSARPRARTIEDELSLASGVFAIAALGSACSLVVQYWSLENHNYVPAAIGAFLLVIAFWAFLWQQFLHIRIALSQRH